MSGTAPGITTAIRYRPAAYDGADPSPARGESVSPGNIDRDLLAVWPRLRRIVAGFGFARHDAEDLLQDVGLRAIRHRATRRDHEDSTGWLVRITVNRCLEERRRLARRRQLDAAVAATRATPESDPPHAAADRDEIALMRQYLLDLDEKLAAPLILGYWCKMTSAQIGELLDEPAATIRTRQRKARLILARQLRQRGVQP